MAKLVDMVDTSTVDFGPIDLKFGGMQLPLKRSQNRLQHGPAKDLMEPFCVYIWAYKWSEGSKSFLKCLYLIMQRANSVELVLTAPSKAIKRFYMCACKNVKAKATMNICICENVCCMMKP